MLLHVDCGTRQGINELHHLIQSSWPSTIGQQSHNTSTASQASWTNHMLMSIAWNESAKSYQAQNPRQSKKVALVQTVITSSQWFIYMYCTTCNRIENHWYLNHQSSWSTNNAISPERNVFGEIHTIHMFKSLQETIHNEALQCKILSTIAIATLPVANLQAVLL